jgi:hypothetical protein
MQSSQTNSLFSKQKNVSGLNQAAQVSQGASE